MVAEPTTADLDAFLALQRGLMAVLETRHGPVHPATCGCGHAERGELDHEGALWRWWAHWFGVCFERQPDGLCIDVDLAGDDPAAIDPWRLGLYLRSRHAVEWELDDVLRWLEQQVVAGTVVEATGSGTRPGLRRFRPAG